MTSFLFLEQRKKSKWDTAGPAATTEAPKVITAPVVADPSAPKVTIPAVGNLFQKK